VTPEAFEAINMMNGATGIFHKVSIHEWPGAGLAHLPHEFTVVPFTIDEAILGEEGITQKAITSATFETLFVPILLNCRHPGSKDRLLTASTFL